MKDGTLTVTGLRAAADSRTPGQIYQAGMDNIVAMYVHQFMDDSEKFFVTLGHSTVPLMILMGTYTLLEKKGDIERLEDLDRETKAALWKQACANVPKDFFEEDWDGKKCQRKREDFCKAVWLIRRLVEG